MSTIYITNERDGEEKREREATEFVVIVVYDKWDKPAVPIYCHS